MTIYKQSLEFYVYAYLRKDGTPYYIGKGKGRRAFSKQHNVKLPSIERIVFLERNLTNIGALALERFYIRWYGRKHNNTGILRNITPGGEGVEISGPGPNTGKIMSDEQKSKISKSSRGHKKSEETKRKMSAAQKEKSLSENTKQKLSTLAKQRTHTEETKKKISLFNLGSKRTDSTKQKMSDTHKRPHLGKKWCTDGASNIICFVDEIPENFRLGRTLAET